MKRFFTILWYVLTLRCEEADRLRAVTPRSDLTWWQKLGEGLHVIGCRSCWNARRNFQQLHQISLHASQHEAEEVPATLTPDAKQRLRDALRSKLND